MPSVTILFEQGSTKHFNTRAPSINKFKDELTGADKNPENPVPVCEEFAHPFDLFCQQGYDKVFLTQDVWKEKLKTREDITLYLKTDDTLWTIDKLYPENRLDDDHLPPRKTTQRLIQQKWESVLGVDRPTETPHDFWRRMTEQDRLRIADRKLQSDETTKRKTEEKQSTDPSDATASEDIIDIPNVRVNIGLSFDKRVIDPDALYSFVKERWQLQVDRETKSVNHADMMNASEREGKVIGFLKKAIQYHRLQLSEHNKPTPTQARFELLCRLHQTFYNFLDHTTRLLYNLHVDLISDSVQGENAKEYGYLLQSKDAKLADEDNHLLKMNNEEADGYFGVSCFSDRQLVKEDTFIKCFKFISGILSCRGYRRADDNYFERTKTIHGQSTMAFTKAMSIEEFVMQHVRHDVNWYMFTLARAPRDCIQALIKTFTTCPMPETPDLVENHHLRHYNGDALGRGCGVYCSNSDFFFPYHKQSQWASMAEEVTMMRKYLDGTRDSPGKPPCHAPCQHDVCIAYMECPFYFDTYAEVKALYQQRLNFEVSFREANESELKSGDNVYVPKRDVHLVRFLDENIRRCSSVLDNMVGRKWSIYSSDAPKVWKEDKSTIKQISNFDEDAMSKLREKYDEAETEEDELIFDHPLVPGIDTNVLVHDTDKGLHFMPLIEPTTQPRATVKFIGFQWKLVRYRPAPESTDCTNLLERVMGFPPDDDGAVMFDIGREMVDSATIQDLQHVDYLSHAICPDGRVYIQHGLLRFDCTTSADTFIRGETRLYRVDTGRTWIDCDVRYVDRVYDCQHFDQEDRLMLYGLKGRLFFRIGERDNNQMTFSLFGEGGCGKTTLHNALCSFWPSHVRGTLPSNVEPQFGMSQAMLMGKAEVVFCGEVGENIKMLQEDWQASTDPGKSSYAVKNKAPCVMENKAQMFWCGNQRPKYDNEANQMGRRLAAVYMKHPVKPRDGRVKQKIEANLAALQRRSILAYEFMISKYDGLDPMSCDDRLPPAFLEYAHRLRMETNPIIFFMRDTSIFVITAEKDKQPGDEEGKITMNRFRELYDLYRQRNEIPKPVRWGPPVYNAAFSEAKVNTAHKDEEEINGKIVRDQLIIYGMREVVEV